MMGTDLQWCYWLAIMLLIGNYGDGFVIAVSDSQWVQLMFNDGHWFSCIVIDLQWLCLNNYDKD